MKTYTILTETTVTRTYEIKAASEKEAKKLFNDDPEKAEFISEDHNGEEVVEIEEN